jgi:TonB dependent receptor-like, beta-barrel/Carboxypeptidase regulatory-like domain
MGRSGGPWGGRLLTGPPAPDTVENVNGANILLEDSALSSCRRFGWAVLATVMSAPAVCAAPSPDDGGVVGWVESTRGVPVAGAVVSIFGKGIRGGSLITLADAQGQFMLPSLPAGSYTLRAIGLGHEASAAQHVTVLPNRDALFTLSLTPVGTKAGEDEAASEAPSEAEREWQWLVRHKRRSVLETIGQEASAGEDGKSKSLALSLPAGARASDAWPVAGSMEIAATSGSGTPADVAGSGLPGGVGSLRLQGQLTEGVRWSLGGLLAEAEGRAWRTAAAFVIEPGGGHEVEVGSGFGAGYQPPVVAGVLPEPDRVTGAVFLRDRWHIGDRVTATTGARYTYIGFLPDSHHADAVVQVELRGDRSTLVRGSVATRTLTPGGDLLTLSTVAASPAITWARLEDGLRPAHSMRYEVGVDRTLGLTRVGAYVFDETTRDLLLTTFDGTTPVVRNAGELGARGMGLTVGRRFGGIADGSVTYTFGRGHRPGLMPIMGDVPVASFDEAQFHDLVARLDTVIDRSDTRVSALCRLTALTDDRAKTAPGAGHASNAARFDVQVTQGLPFLQPLTRADWEILVAVRNMFYEASQGAFLDELAVQDPPTRVVGGISVRF